MRPHDPQPISFPVQGKRQNFKGGRPVENNPETGSAVIETIAAEMIINTCNPVYEAL